MQSPDLNKMAYHRTEADRLIRINREQLNIPEEQTALATARDQGREEILAAALKEKAKGGIFRRDGRALIDILDEVCIDTDTNTPAEEKLLLDEHSIRSWLGKKKQDTPDGWVKYWSKIKDGRMMASMGDLYESFKLIQKLRQSGTVEEQAKAQLYLDSLREDFIWSGKKGGLVANTRLFYSANSLDARVVQHYKCIKPELTHEQTITVPDYSGDRVEQIADDKTGLIYLQTILDTEDDAETIIRTLEFISGKGRSDICCWTAPTKSGKYFTRTKHPERAAWFGCISNNLYLYGNRNLNYNNAARGVRLA